MGTSLGCIKFSDGTILFTGYQNTSDVMHGILYDTIDEYLNDEEYHKRERECNCNDLEEVEIATNYGGGFSWKGQACKRCEMLVYGNSGASYDWIDKNNEIQEYHPKDYKDGLPEWFPE